jgi:hypothetical protein
MPVYDEEYLEELVLSDEDLYYRPSDKYFDEEINDFIESYVFSARENGWD